MRTVLEQVRVDAGEKTHQQSEFDGTSGLRSLAWAGLLYGAGESAGGGAL